MNHFNNFRYEVSHKNSLHTPKQQEAIEKMIAMWILIPFEESNHPTLYHGSQNMDLKIDEFYKGKNRNALAFNGLYTTEDFDLANDTYAKNGGKVYEIVPRRGGGYIFDVSKKLSEDEKRELWQIMEIFMPKISEIPHNEYLDKKSAEKFLEEQKELLNDLKGRNHIFWDYREVEEFKRKSPKEYQMMAKLNTFYYIVNNPHRLFSLVGLSALNGKQPIDADLVNVLIEKMWIIGGKVPISSASAGKIIIPVVFSDLSKIQVKEVNEKQKNMARNVFHETAKKFGENIDKNWKPINSQTHNLKNVINSPYIDAFEIIEMTKNISPKWKQVFESEVGVWEGYTLEEHVETVLNNFERNFGDRIPIGILGFMRLAILVHDIGKNHKQGVKYDIEMIREFLGDIGVSGELFSHIELFVTKSLDFAYRFFVAKDFSRNSQTQEEFKELQSMKNGDAILNLLRAFAISDGGAYTSMGVTRRRIGDLGIIAHRNAASFNSSFKAPQDISKRLLDYRDNQ